MANQTTIRRVAEAAARDREVLLRPAGMLSVLVRSTTLALLAFLTYVLLAQLSLLFVVRPQNFAAIWPPAGLALGMLLVARDGWKPVSLGVAVAVAVSNLGNGMPIGATIGFMLANLAEPLTAALLLRRAGFVSFATLTDVGRFTLYGIVVGPVVGATLGTTTAALAFGAPPMPSAVTWFLGDAGGVVALTPAFVLLARGMKRPQHLRLSRLVEGGALTLATVGLLVLTFGPSFLPFQLAAYPLFLLVTIAAFRYGFVAAALATLAAAAISMAGTVAGFGPLVATDVGVAVRIGQTHIFVLVAYFISFVIAGAQEDRRRALGTATALAETETQRADQHRRVADFAREISETIERDALYQRIVLSGSRVLPVEVVQLTVAVEQGGPHQIVAAVGAPNAVGKVIAVGDGITGRVLERSAPVVRSDVAQAERSVVHQDVMPAVPMAVAVYPILIDGAVHATLGFGRPAANGEFSADELRTIQMVVGLTVAAMRVVTVLGLAEERAVRDELTGVPNRRYFSLAFDQLVALRQRQAVEQRSVVSAVLFDLDHFGTVNKERGHATGDSVLTEFGAILSARLRRADIVARYGGEEFIAILVGTQAAEAVRVADDIRHTLEARTFIGEDGAALRCTVSAGVAEAGAEDGSLERLVATADVGLAMAKRAGRNQVASA